MIRRRCPVRCRHAFTLIELLFVVAIIAVLAAIAVPNFLAAQTRAKTARTQTDMAAVVMALNRYYNDHAAYPPNHPEARRYLDFAMQHPILDSDHTSAPADAKIPWWPMPRDESEPDFMDFPGMYFMGMPMHMELSDFESTDFAPLQLNSWQLTILTSPIPYISSYVVDVFSSEPTQTFAYVNTAEIFTNDTATTHPGLWGDHLTTGTYFYLASPGPDGIHNFWHLISGPWIPYNPTNGTASNGDLMHFEGRKPSAKPGSDELRPNYIGR